MVSPTTRGWSFVADEVFDCAHDFIGSTSREHIGTELPGVCRVGDRGAAEEYG
jgi:hypothetical protein